MLSIESLLCSCCRLHIDRVFWGQFSQKGLPCPGIDRSVAWLPCSMLQSTSARLALEGSNRVSTAEKWDVNEGTTHCCKGWRDLRQGNSKVLITYAVVSKLSLRFTYKLLCQGKTDIATYSQYAGRRPSFTCILQLGAATKVHKSSTTISLLSLELFLPRNSHRSAVSNDCSNDNEVPVPCRPGKHFQSPINNTI